MRDGVLIYPSIKCSGKMKDMTNNAYINKYKETRVQNKRNWRPATITVENTQKIKYKDWDNWTTHGSSCSQNILSLWSLLVSTKFVRSRPAQCGVYSMQYYVIKFVVTGWWFSPGTPVFSTNKTDPHFITEILLKVASNTMPLLFRCCIAVA